MTVRVAALNLKDGFSGARPDKIQRYICDTVKPDVAVFPEAYSEKDDDMIRDVRRRFGDWGYRAVTTYYNDRDGRSDRHGLMVIARKELILNYNPVYNDKVVRLAEGTGLDRSAIRLHMEDPDGYGEFDFYGVHFDDRKETTRMRQALSLLGQMDSDRPAVVAGDYNNMYRNKRAALLRGLGYATRLLGQGEPGVPVPEGFVDKIGYYRRRLGSLGCRLGGMAEGKVLQLFNDHDFYDDDEPHEATMNLGRFSIAELDHIMARGMTVSDYKVEKPGLSDHNAVTAMVTPIA